MVHFSVPFIILVTQLVTATDRHKIVYKSLQRASDECKQYNVQEDCLARCITLVTRDWTDSDGLSPVYGRFFHPNPNDTCSDNRTQRCLQSSDTKVSRSSKCTRSSESVQCYLDQYGTVNTTVPQSIRFTTLHDAQLVLECAAMLGYASFEQLNELLNDDNFVRQETRCVMRCFMIRSGLYSDSAGLNMARYYVLCGGYEDSFYEQVAECSARLRQEVSCDDKCTLAQRLAIECIGVDYATSTILQQKGNSYDIIQAYQGSEVYNIDAQNANSNVALSAVQQNKAINIDNINSDFYKFGDKIKFD
ncbi:general odorant-binding protein 45-like [Armigeres subalbatus]|uniref:general odorant-binding protein 45-like n=1 Tax=Armigeres subalbatus TaxID=124917 RepID=UPI002ED3312F